MRCPSTKTQAHPRNWAQSWCPRTRSESPSQPLWPESRNTPRPHRSVSMRHTFPKFLFHCFADLSTRTNEQLVLLVCYCICCTNHRKTLAGQSQDRSLLRSCSGRSHAILPAPTNLFQCDIHSLNSFSIVLRICQLVPMSSSFY